jgi:glutathione peroxidase
LSEEANPRFVGWISWNFAKFMVNRKGQAIVRFDPGVGHESPEMISAIEKALAER